jgi:hypothetical protein
MKISDVTEAPVSGLKKTAMKYGSKALGAVGATGTSANLRGKTNLAATANNLYKQFAEYLGTQDKKISHATGQDLVTFLKSKSHNTKANIPSGVLSKQQLNDILMAASKEALAGQGGVSQTSSQEPASEPSDQEVKKRVPNELYQALLKLTPEEKKQLAELI